MELHKDMCKMLFIYVITADWHQEGESGSQAMGARYH